MSAAVMSLRARALRRGFGLAVRGLRWSRGGLPDPDGPEEALEAYALRARTQLEQLVARLPAPRGSSIIDDDTAPVRTLTVVDGAVQVHDAVRVHGAVRLGHAADAFASATRVVLYLHGGVYCMGSPETHRGLAAALSRQARAAVVLPEYRLAPEHRYPAALDDVLATWDWLTEVRGVDPARIAVAGDSAGAGLAAALCVRLVAAGRAVPACLVGLSPWMDLAGTGASLVDNGEVDIWIPPALVVPAARSYAGETALDHPLLSPLYADLAGVPPVLLQVGTDEVLLDDATRFVDAARRHGVDASLARFEGLWHVFQVIPGFPEARDALREVGGFVRRHTTPLEERDAA